MHHQPWARVENQENAWSCHQQEGGFPMLRAALVALSCPCFPSTLSPSQDFCKFLHRNLHLSRWGWCSVPSGSTGLSHWHSQWFLRHSLPWCIPRGRWQPVVGHRHTWGGSKWHQEFPFPSPALGHGCLHHGGDEVKKDGEKWEYSSRLCCGCKEPSRD